MTLRFRLLINAYYKIFVLLQYLQRSRTKIRQRHRSWISDFRKNVSINVEFNKVGCKLHSKYMAIELIFRGITATFCEINQ